MEMIINCQTRQPEKICIAFTLRTLYLIFRLLAKKSAIIYGVMEIVLFSHSLLCRTGALVAQLRTNIITLLE